MSIVTHRFAASAADERPESVLTVALADHLKRLGPLLSPNVLFNEMSDAERTAFIEDYRRQGPAGRPAPQNA